MIEMGPLVASELVSCIADARYPTAQELGRLAARIMREIGGNRPAFAWQGPDDPDFRVRSYRIAHAALVGDDSASGMAPVGTRDDALSVTPSI